ncbi:tetratricopeptide repeat protein [Archangium violaceum]|uniref:tetratricopeptide repeat protein n=1 Tax=Archangium violaceum TaxID=83451 RepID=UPI00193C5372|nr:tetratricopeptide repeat protein [Archangium violaceum]QRK08510.1 tetratricopeptide repeat protein [Archangium violaceum]
MRRLLAPGLLLLSLACATTPGPGPEAGTDAPPTKPSDTSTPDTSTPDTGTPPAATLEKQPTRDTGKKAPPAAESSYKTQAERRPKDDRAWTNLGIVQERMGRNDEAERSYRQALTLKPDQQAAWDNLTRLQCRTGRAAQAESSLREQLQATPGAVAPRIALVQALLCQKKLDAAATEAKRVLKAEERNVRAMQLLAQVYYRERKYELARMVLENARTLAPGEAVTHNALGLVQLALGSKPAALEAFKKASELKPEFAEARNNLGALLNEAQDHEAAARELEAAVQAAPDFVSARLNLGNAYRGLGDFARALAEYQHVLRLAPELPDTLFNLAILHLDAEPPDMDTLVRLQTSLSYFEQYRAKGGKDERVDTYVKDARKGIEKEERRREREKREQLRKAQKAEEDKKKAGGAPPPAPEAAGSGRVAEDKK